MAEGTQEIVTTEGSQAIVVKPALPLDPKAASLQGFFSNEEKFPGLVYDPTRKCFPQLKAYFKRNHPDWKPAQITAAAEKVVFEDLRMYTDTEVTRLMRDYRAELPKYGKKVDPYTGEALKVDVSFTRKPGLGITMEQFIEGVKKGDKRLVDVANKIGFKLDQPEVRDIQS
jgi:hypothetical protein